MSKQKERILAYQKAKIISNEALENISGGRFDMCTKISFGPTGSPQKPDQIPDIIFD